MIKEFANSGYMVSSEGFVYGKYKPDQPLSNPLDRYGYKKVALSIEGKMKFMTLHRVLALTFLPNPENLPCVNHIDGNKLNNSLDNLEWCTFEYNTKHSAANGLHAKGEEVGLSVLTDIQVHEICRMIQDGFRNNDIAKKVGIERYLVHKIRHRETWNHISKDYNFPHIAHQGISMATFYWVCHKLQEGWKYKQILEAYTGGEYLTYSCLKRIKNRKMRSEYSKDFTF